MTFPFGSNGRYSCSVWVGGKNVVGPFSSYMTLEKARARVRKELEKHGDKVTFWSIIDDEADPPKRVAGGREDGR